VEFSEVLEGDRINNSVPIVIHEIKKKGFIIEPKTKKRTMFSVSYRYDPLTEKVAVIFPSESYKTRLFTNKTDWTLVDEIFDQSEKLCPFCPEKREKFVPHFIEMDNLNKGEASLFPNLFPQWEHHAVIALTKHHKILPNEFSEKQFFDGFLLAFDYFKRLIAEENIPYASINMNYLPPAGATLAHPHFQVLAGELPSNWQKELLLHSEQYFMKNKKKYWADLVEREEKEGKRFLGETKDIFWIVPFAPKASYEVRAVFPSSNLLRLSNGSMMAFSGKLTEILEFYRKYGDFSSFNFSLIGSLNDENEDYFSIVFSIIPRQNLYSSYRSEYNYMSSIQDTRFISKSPELYAEEIRDKVFNAIRSE